MTTSELANGRRRMPRTEVDLDVAAVRRLIATCFPDYAELPVTELAAPGTQNIMYRLGRDLCIRLPRRQRVVRRLEKELRWLPAISRRSPLEVPAPVASADASGAYPMPWAIYRWIDGEPFSAEDLVDEDESARRLAAFVTALRTLDRTGAPPSQQDRSVADRDRDVRRAVPLVSAVFDRAKVARAWERLLDALPWTGASTWTHGDLLPTNFLMRRGRLTAIIDFGCAGIGDPALDLLPAWAAFGARGRATFRSALAVDDATWRRGQALALHQAVVIAADQLPWNGPMLPVAVRTGESVLSDG
jgi:aminoglycoside phosphotransferase (APT) family kinase protein